MAHYAFLNDDNIVTKVIVGIDETELIEGISPEIWYGNLKNQKCLRTSYNANIRKNYAGIGYFYDEELDAFIPPKPFDSWLLNKQTCQWFPPIARPDGLNWIWDEEQGNWVNA